MSKARAGVLKGFTLIELMIGMTVSVLVGGLLLSLLVNNTRVSYQQSAKVTQGIGANDTSTNIITHIKQAAAVDSTSNGAHLVLKLPSIDNSGDFIMDAYDLVDYAKNGDKIRQKVIPSVNPASSRNSADRILAFNCTELMFEYLDVLGSAVTPSVATKVKVTVKLEQDTGSGLQTDTVTTEAELRND